MGFSSLWKNITGSVLLIMDTGAGAGRKGCGGIFSISVSGNGHNGVAGVCCDLLTSLLLTISNRLKLPLEPRKKLGPK